MLSFSVRTFALCLVFGLAGFGRAAPQAVRDPDREPFTVRELRQGYRDTLILARPRADRRAETDAAEAREGIRVREKFPRFRDLRIVEVGDTDTPEAAMARLRATGRYEFVEPDYLRHISAEPNDPQYINGALWALKNTGLSNGIAGADIKATAAWDIVREAPNVIVAVIDTGVNLNHQDLAGNLWRNPAPTFGDINGARFLNGRQTGDPTDDNGHGTHVAGTIGAVGNNGLGIAGIAWRVQIMAIKTFPATGSGSVSDIARGVNYAVQRGAHIINASYGALGNTGFSNTEFAAISAAREAGILFVAAAGNSAANLDVSRAYPANHALDNIVTVGNSTRRDELALSTNVGSGVDLFAPGSEIVSLSSTSNTGTTTLSGTSMAAPHVSGALALLRAQFPADTHRQLINRLLRSVDPGDRFAGRAHTGGRLNLEAALRTTSNRPFNDDFAARPRFNADNLSLRSSNAGATPDPAGPEPAHAGFAPSATLWWQWTATATGTVTVHTSGSSYDTVLAVYTGSALGTLAPVAANDNDAGTLTSRVTFTAQAGTAYQIAVDGKSGGSGLTLLALGTTPANDLFATPVQLAGQSARVTATNANSSREAGEPRILGFSGGTSLWYRWTAPRSGRFQVSAVSNDFDPLLAVYTGSALETLALVAANDNASATVAHTGALCTLNAVAGTTYLFTVDSKSAAAVGQFTLTLTDSLWQFATGDAIPGSPAIARDGTVYIGSSDRSFYALAPDGTAKWSYTTGGIIDTTSPAVAEDGTVYVGSYDGNLYAFAPEGGQPKWTRNFGTAAVLSSSPTVGADGTVYVRTGDGFFYALDPATGVNRWRYNINAPQTYASATIAPDGTIYQGSENGRLYALNPDGTLKWEFNAANEIYTAPALDAAGNVYFGVLGSGRLFSLTPAGTQRWVYDAAPGGSSSSPALSADGTTVYFGGYDKKFHAVNTATGTARWVYTLGDEVRASSPAVDANGTIYIGCYDFKLYALRPDGTLLRTYDTGNWVRSAPVIHGTTLYVGSNDDKLYAFDLGTGTAGGPWPQYRHNARRIGRAVAAPLTFESAPVAQAAVAGETVRLAAVASGDAAIAYQWFKDGQPVAGATAATLVLPAIASAQAGNYTVTASAGGTVLVSPPAAVTVRAVGEAAAPGRLVNLSVRTGAGSGAQTLIVGFFVAGAPDKPLLLRAVGPGLSPFGVENPLADPRLQLLSGTGAIAENNDWGGGAALADAFASVGAFALAAGSRDAALLRAVPQGAYTAQITGAAGTGIALAEVYETASASGARLANLSARSQVNGGGDILIAGFALSGNVPKKILIRGIGPGLDPFGVAGTLADPVLTLYRGAAKLAENDTWGAAPALNAAFAQVSAFALPAASRDAALVVTLVPGAYTAQVSSATAATGVALVEVYELP